MCCEWFLWQRCNTMKKDAWWKIQPLTVFCMDVAILKRYSQNSLLTKYVWTVQSQGLLKLVYFWICLQTTKHESMWKKHIFRAPKRCRKSYDSKYSIFRLQHPAVPKGLWPYGILWTIFWFRFFLLIEYLLRSLLQSKYVHALCIQIYSGSLQPKFSKLIFGYTLKKNRPAWKLPYPLPRHFWR